MASSISSTRGGVVFPPASIRQPRGALGLEPEVDLNWRSNLSVGTVEVVIVSQTGAKTSARLGGATHESPTLGQALRENPQRVTAIVAYRLSSRLWRPMRRTRRVTIIVQCRLCPSVLHIEGASEPRQILALAEERGWVQGGFARNMRLCSRVQT